MDTAYTLSCGSLNIPCYLSLPDHGQIRRLILGVHGLTGSAEDPIQANIAEEMTLFFSAAFRFDFPAHGSSPHSSDDFTVSNCVQCLLAVAKDAKNRYPQVEDLCIFATGFGAYITLLALHELNQLPGRVKLVIQTPSVKMDETLLSMLNLSAETFRVMESIELPTKRPLKLHYDLYKELRDNSVILPHPIPMLILHTEGDRYIPMSHIHDFRQLNEDAKLVVISGTCHQFTEDGAWDMVLDLARDWFDFEQVLLADWE